jgi:hypothetical protein
LYCFYFFVLQIITILIMLQGGNCREVADPLDMEIFEDDEYALIGWDKLRPNKV